MINQTVGPLPVWEGEGIVRAHGNMRVTWSSARGVSCPLKWVNERNPHPVLNNSQETAPPYGGEEGEDDVKSARFLHPGLQTPYNGEKQRVAST